MIHNEAGPNGRVAAARLTPTPTALYFLYGANEDLLYVGVAADPEKRWYQHSCEKEWWRLVERKEKIWFDNRPAAEDAEARAIVTLRPRFNVAGQPQPEITRVPGAELVTGSADIADHLRGRIASGELAPGSLFPSETQLQREYGFGRDAVRKAVGYLASEGLVVVQHGRRSTVADFTDKEAVLVAAGSTVDARSPTMAEREALRMPHGWPVLHVVRPDGSGDLYPAHRYRVVVASAE